MIASEPKIMGVINVTPDSFSGEGRFLDPEDAVDHGQRLLREGADLLDVGGESTRPRSEAIPASEEAERVVPVITALAGTSAAPVSIDTSKAEVAAAGIDAGAAIVNDVTALGDPDMAPLCAERGVKLILMHMQGTPRTMQDNPTYDDVVDDIRAFLTERIERAVAAGIDHRRIWIDPGIGFGKTVSHNLELIRRLGEFRDLEVPILLGASRKSFLGKLTGREVDERLGGSIAAAVVGLLAGADALRVHDVAATRDAVTVTTAIAAGRPWRAG